MSLLQGKLNRQNIIDTLGGILSLGCAIHCLFVPFLVLVWPVLGETFIADHLFHKVLLYGIIPIAFFALFWGCRKHKQYHILAIGSLGLGLLTYFTLTESNICDHCITNASFDFWNWPSDLLMHKGGMVLASVLLCIAHWKNFKTCQQADCSH